MTQAAPAISAPLPLSSRRRWAVTAGVMTGMFLAALEATVVSTAMPTVIASLGGLAHYSWVFSAYLITSTVTVPVWGRLSDIYGRRRLYQWGIAVFLLGSVLSGLSQSMAQLIAARAVQGLGAGALVPLSMTIIGDIYTLEERARMQAVFSGVWGLSSILGPVAGGFITDNLSWRWVFYLNLPVGVISSAIIGMALIEPAHGARRRIDYAGTAVLMTSITLLMLGLVGGGQGLDRLLEPLNLALLAASLALAVLFVVLEKRADDPIVPLRLFSNRMVSVSVTAAFLAGVAMFGTITFVPLFAQGTMGLTATDAGSLLTPLMLSWVILSIVGGRLLLKVGFRTTTLAGFIVLTAGLVLLATFQPSMPRSWLYAHLVVVGAGLGLTMLTLLIAIQHAVPRSELGLATSLNQFSRSIGGAIGVGVMGVVLAAGLTSHLVEAAGRGLLPTEEALRLAHDPSALIQIDSQSGLSPGALLVLRSSLAAATHVTFWIAAASSALGFVVALFLPRTAVRPQDEACRPETGERLVMAELATIDPEHEPKATEPGGGKAAGP